MLHKFGLYAALSYTIRIKTHVQCVRNRHKQAPRRTARPSKQGQLVGVEQQAGTLSVCTSKTIRQADFAKLLSVGGQGGR